MGRAVGWGRSSRSPSRLSPTRHTAVTQHARRNSRHIQAFEVKVGPSLGPGHHLQSHSRRAGTLVRSRTGQIRPAWSSDWLGRLPRPRLLRRSPRPRPTTREPSGKRDPGSPRHARRHGARSDRQGRVGQPTPLPIVDDALAVPPVEVHSRLWLGPPSSRPQPEPGHRRGGSVRQVAHIRFRQA